MTTLEEMKADPLWEAVQITTAKSRHGDGDECTITVKVAADVILPYAVYDENPSIEGCVKAFKDRWDYDMDFIYEIMSEKLKTHMAEKINAIAPK